ncbi:hypothetical protein Cni_G04166 [Canna indica]|uniref:Uncharacterized protein n=1 Tax=Canna indica TaxID=4628 RepID=A0AAQ3JUV9_9LILI|nr:hypothetical protein Cni_G04166 [Canna indica]
MGRQSNDSIVLNSSIALLQERFKQLQRDRERREERELRRSSVFRSQSVQREQLPEWLFASSPTGRRYGWDRHYMESSPQPVSLDTSLSVGFSRSSALGNETEHVDTSLHL